MTGLPPRLDDRRWLFWVKLDLPADNPSGVVFHGKTHYLAAQKAAVHFGVSPEQLGWRPAWRDRP